MLILHAVLYCRVDDHLVLPSVRQCYCPFSFPLSLQERERKSK